MNIAWDFSSQNIVTQLMLRKIKSNNGLISDISGKQTYLVGRSVRLYLMRVTSDSNITDNLMVLNKKNKLIAIVVTILIVIKIVYKPLYIAK